MNDTRPINLAVQGDGSRAAFTWGANAKSADRLNEIIFGGGATRRPASTFKSLGVETSIDIRARFL